MRRLTLGQHCPMHWGFTLKTKVCQALLLRLFPDWGQRVTSCQSLLLPCLPGHAGLHPIKQWAEVSSSCLKLLVLRFFFFVTKVRKYTHFCIGEAKVQSSANSKTTIWRPGTQSILWAKHSVCTLLLCCNRVPSLSLSKCKLDKSTCFCS